MSEEVEDIQHATETEAGGRETVGQILRAAREAASLTVTDVAQSLKFSPRQIEQLEADDYTSLPGTTIVRGFARSYARLLKLDADALLRMLDDLSPNSPADVRPPDNMGVASEPSGLRQISPLASVAIVLILAALLLALWHFLGPKTSNQSVEPVAENNQTVMPSAAVPVSVPAAPPESADQPQTVAPSPVTDAGTAQPQPQPQPQSVVPTLVFSLEDRSWVEVVDSKKQVLHTGESPAGSRLTLSGQPPFDIVIGKAGKVKLTYGEREIDLAPYTRADVARLKLE